MTTSELELIRDYASEGSQAAFAELVRRHVDLVYSAALRQVRSPDLAEEVTQSVFLALAGNAHKLKPQTPLTAWLYLVTRRAAINVVRRESRRQAREQTAAEMATMKTDSPSWSRVEPLLDEAMAALPETDRSAVLLRFFEGRSLREVGGTLGVSEDAAQKRVSRAIDQLRLFLSKRGVAVGATALAADLASGAVQTAPIGLGLSIASTAAVSGVAGQVAVAETVHLLTMTTIQKTLVVTALAVVAGAGFYGQRVISREKSELLALQAQAARLGEENRQLRRDREADAQLLGAAQTALDAARAKPPGGAAPAASGDPGMESELKNVLARVITLKERLASASGPQIPELRLLKEQDWINAAARHKLGTEEDLQAALADLRSSGKVNFSDQLSKALWQYAHANDGQIPTDIAALKPFFDSPVPDEMLQRYGIVHAGKLSEPSMETIVIAETALLESTQDGTFYMSGPRTQPTQGNMMIHSGRYSDVSSPVLQALSGFIKANPGAQPTDPAQLAPYLPAPVDPAKLQGYWKALGLPKDVHFPKD